MDPTLLFIIIFLVVPILERIFKASRQQQQPPEKRPQPPRAPQQRPRLEPRRPAPPEDEDAEPGTAAEMLPDDLWAILTGERRPRPSAEQPRKETPAPVPTEPRPRPPLPMRPRPQPTSQQAPSHARERRLPSVDMRTELPPDEEATFRKAPAAEQYPVEAYIREIPIHKPPEIVSLEEIDLDEERRHARFHKRVAVMAAPARVRRTREHELAKLFHQPNELRRAFVMSEVLNKPKGLE